MDFINFSSLKKILQKITQYKNNIYICITVILWYSRYRIILLS